MLSEELEREIDEILREGRKQEEAQPLMMSTRDIIITAIGLLIFIGLMLICCFASFNFCC